MNTVYKALGRLIDCIVPPGCILCGDRTSGERDLCTACSRRLPRIAQACHGCGLPLSEPADNAPLLCGHCLQRPSHFDRLLSPLRYEPPVDWLIQRFKYQAHFNHARLLGRILCAYLESAVQDKPECIIPVPLHINRLGERGFNQATMLAGIVAETFSIPLKSNACLRNVDTPKQSSLSAKQRRKNLRYAFSVIRPPGFKHVAIVDDVVTTGATVNALSRVLKQNGVRKIQVWSVARTAAARGHQAA